MDDTSRHDAAIATHVELPSLIGRLHRQVALGEVSPNVDDVLAAAVSAGPWLTTETHAAAARRVMARVGGIGEVEELLDLDGVTDVLINGPGPVSIERHGQLEITPLVLDADGVAVLVERLTSLGRRRVDATQPVVDLRLPGGLRAHVVVEPAAVGGPHVSIRRFAPEPLSLDSFGSDAVVRALRCAVRERRNILICGPTGSGKTSLLGALIDEVQAEQRIVVIEDAAELAPRRDVVRLEAQPAGGEGRPQVSLHDLVRASLRMRPDRLVVGEVRGAEAVDLLHALGTGHAGSMSTIHASAPAAALRRLRLLVGATSSLDGALVSDQVESVIDLVVHVERQADGRRQVVGMDVAAGC